jgi:4-hydroxy-2-oxoheptanedioate aldolase
MRDRLHGNQTLFGGWSVIPDQLSAGAMAAGGLDYVVIDLQHGGATERDLPALTGAITRAGATPVARVRYAHPADIGRALDLGCAGVIVPNVESVAQARASAGACNYPPAGYRSGGGVLASSRKAFCIIMVESSPAMSDLDATLAVPGVDGIYVGPRDLSYSLGCELDPDDPVLGAALERIGAACAAAGKPMGVHSTNGVLAARYRNSGCRLVNVAADASALTNATSAELAAARQ